MAHPALVQPQAIQSVFFDAGYTLLAPHPSTIELVRMACADCGLPISVEDIERQLPNAEAEFQRHYQFDRQTWSDEANIQGIWRAYYAVLLEPLLRTLEPEQAEAVLTHVQEVWDRAESYALYPDVLPALKALRAAGKNMGIISDWGIGLGLILRHHDLVQYFDFAVISAAVRHAKPDPALYQTALERANAVPDYTIHVGDSYTLDVLGARSVGITPILLDRKGRVDPNVLDCLVVRDLYHLLDLLGLHPAGD